MSKKIKEYLNHLVEKYNNPAFIAEDPICLPHRFTKKQDIEIIGFWVSILAWGQRKTIIKSGERLLELMDHSPYDFVLNHGDSDLKRFERFVHRTFQPTDALYFLHFFKMYYSENESLENAFSESIRSEDITVENGLVSFAKTFFDDPYTPKRTRKHIASPIRKSTCKRINMFLRWMVRNDGKGVDFGLWNTIRTDQLLIPYDVHVERNARKLGLLKRKQRDWKAVIELTDNLKSFDAHDPVKYDYALFGLGVLQKDDPDILLLP
jgi:uncharacterized protein (TIGR02757 family)